MFLYPLCNSKKKVLPSFCLLRNQILQQSDMFQISIEATSTVDSIVSIDYVDITRSNMPCGNGELVCYPGVSGRTPLEADSSVQRCSSDQEESAVRSCDFTPEDKIGPATCGWDVSPGWDVRQKRDGTGLMEISDSYLVF